jgi:hypothetical protein
MIVLFLAGGCALEYGETIEVEEEFVAASMAAAHASGLDERESSSATLAEFEGQIIDLSGGWGEANACLVSPVRDVAECFRTKEEADARAAEIDQLMEDSDLAPQAGDEDSYRIPASYCSSWLYIYQHVGCKGRDLRFSRRRYIHNLTAWGFNDEMSSYNTGPCNVTFWEHVNNKGSKFVASANGPCKNVSRGWNDKASSLWIW